MWLIDTKTLRLVEKNDVSEVKYAILSHTWEEGEVTFQEFQNLQRACRKRGFSKIRKTCQLARENHNLAYAWVDTCCIDKSNSTEVSEAIRSMFKYYERSSVCFVYLGDLSSDPLTGPFFGSRARPPPSFSRCRWLTRGWTLQELIAPGSVLFYDASWSYRGSKDGWATSLALITGIHLEALSPRSNRPLVSPRRRMDDYSVAARFSWAAKRETTRTEDLAYCLLGIFGVYMDLQYGEGENAFRRLQEVISKSTTDMSIFAWQAAPDDKQKFRGLFAKSPSEFVRCAAFARKPLISRSENEYSITNNGLRFEQQLISVVKDPDRLKFREHIEPNVHSGEAFDEHIKRMGVVSMDLEIELHNTASSTGTFRIPQCMHIGIFLTMVQGRYVRTWPHFLSLQFSPEIAGTVVPGNQPAAIYAPATLTEQESWCLRNALQYQAVVKLIDNSELGYCMSMKHPIPQSAWHPHCRSFRLQGCGDTGVHCGWLIDIDPSLSGIPHQPFECLVVCTLKNNEARSYIFARENGRWKVGGWSLSPQVFFYTVYRMSSEETEFDRYQEWVHNSHDHHRAGHWDGESRASLTISKPDNRTLDRSYQIDITVSYKRCRDLTSTGGLYTWARPRY